MIVLAIGALPLYAAQRYQADPMRQAVDLIKDRSTPDRANVLFDRVDTYERLAPFMPGWSPLAALQLGGKADAWSEQNVQAFSTEKPELWYVLDFGADQKKDQRQAIDRRLSETLCKVSSEFAGSAQVSRFVTTPLAESSSRRHADRFVNGLQLDNVRVNRTNWGEPLCFEFQWHTTQPLSTDYTVFIHVLDQNGQIVAQTDSPPGGGYAPTSSWPIGQPIIDRHGLILPPSVLTPGEYRIVAGLYGPDGVRLSTIEESDTILLHKIVRQ
jgi:hypothetical protein